MTIRMCTKETNTSIDKSTNLESYIACRLIPLDKQPGIRPTGIGETILSILSVIKPNLMASAENLQLCAGQPARCEFAIHAITEIFKEDETDGLLLIDAENAFNSLNRSVLLHNIQYVCPPMSTYIRNCYKFPSRLFVIGGREIASVEGTTQGNPLAMPSYAIGINEINVKHVAYADDLGGAGKITEMLKWWNNVVNFGPLIGYYPKASKSWLVVKQQQFETAKHVFKDTNINITTESESI